MLMAGSFMSFRFTAGVSETLSSKITQLCPKPSRMGRAKRRGVEIPKGMEIHCFMEGGGLGQLWNTVSSSRRSLTITAYSIPVRESLPDQKTLNCQLPLNSKLSTLNFPQLSTLNSKLPPHEGVPRSGGGVLFTFLPQKRYTIVSLPLRCNFFSLSHIA